MVNLLKNKSKLSSEDNDKCLMYVSPPPRYVYNATNWPQQLHNRYWSSDNVYAKQNGGKWNFIIEGDFALPTDAVRDGSYFMRVC